MAQSRSFGVDVSSEEVKLDSEGRGEKSFTVKNNASRPARGRARVIPIGSTQAQWLTIAGDTERTFSGGETDVFIVNLQVPTGTPAGKYTFRFDMVSTADPQDDYTEGPVVSAEVPETVVEHPFPWWIVAVGAAVVVVGALVGYFLLRKVEVPEVTGKTVAQATQILTDQGLEAKTVERMSNIDPPPALGTVFEQDPQAKTRVKSGSSVDLYVEPEAVVSGVHNLKEAQAKQKLEGMCEPKPCVHVVVNTEPSSSVSKGMALRTVPPANTRVRRGSAVALMVSGGPASVTLPNVIDIPEALAKEQLETFCGARPCVNVTIGFEGSATIDNGRAIGTNPPAGTAVTPGSNVALIISQVVSAGQRALQRQETLDLDDGTVRGPSSMADLWYNVNGGTLEPGLDSGRPDHRNRFVAFGHTSPWGPQKCANRLESSAFIIHSIPLAQVSPGQCACVVTTDNKISEIQIVRINPNSIVVDYKTWPGRAGRFGIDRVVSSGVFEVIHH